MSAVALILVAGVMVGCSDVPKPDLSDAPARVKKVQTFTEIYKAVDGDYEKLSPKQKAELIEVQGGSEAKAHAAFIGAKEGPMAAQKFLAEARARGELK